RLPTRNDRRSNCTIAPLEPEHLYHLISLAPDLFRGSDPRNLEQFYWHNRFYDFPRSLFALKDGGSGEILGVYLLVVSEQFADPHKIVAAMPCLRLGAFGTEHERHKRVNGLFSCAFANESVGETLLAQAITPQPAGSTLTHLAAQVPSDSAALCAWYDR